MNKINKNTNIDFPEINQTEINNMKNNNLHYNKNTNTKWQLFLFICILCSSCELIVIGEKQKSEPVLDYNKNTPFGIVMRFKMQLDSNNEKYASLLLASPFGKKYNAFERYELQSEVSRFKRQIINKNITNYRTDTLSDSRLNVKLELDYIHNVFFSTQKIKENWYIIDFQIQ